MALNIDKLKSAGAEVVKSTASGLAFVVALGGLPKDKADAILLNLQSAADALYQLVGAVSNLWILIVPLVVTVVARMGWTGADAKVLVGRALAQATKPTPDAEDAKVALVSAAASPEIGSRGVVNARLAANPATPANVVASATMLPPH